MEPVFIGQCTLWMLRHHTLAHGGYSPNSVFKPLLIV
jgi:hypothetical protein